jgi:hypothetical protein
MKYNPFDYIEKPQKRYFNSSSYVYALQKKGVEVFFDIPKDQFYWIPPINFHLYNYYRMKKPKGSIHFNTVFGDINISKNGKLSSREYFMMIPEKVAKEMLAFSKALDNGEFETFDFRD